MHRSQMIYVKNPCQDHILSKIGLIWLKLNSECLWALTMNEVLVEGFNVFSDHAKKVNSLLWLILHINKAYLNNLKSNIF